MPADNSLPFQSFSFTLVEGKQPRCAFRMRATGDGTYEMHAEKGSAANPIKQFTRNVPCETAVRLRDALQDIGVFGWDESYGNDPARGVRRWTISTVFKEDVFSVTSRGGSEVPPGFDQLLEELYRLDFPRPQSRQPNTAPSGIGSAMNSMGLGGLGSIGGMNVGDLGAYSSTGSMPANFPSLSDLTGGEGAPGLDEGEIAGLISEIQRNPQALQDRMKEEFRHLPPDEQNRMLDALASTGMASRAWWERFLRG